MCLSGKCNLTYPMSLPVSQGVSRYMPSFMLIDPKLQVLEDTYRHTDANTDRQTALLLLYTVNEVPFDD